MTRRKGNKKSGARLYQGARSQACPLAPLGAGPEPCRRAAKGSWQMAGARASTFDFEGGMGYNINDQ